MRSKIIILIIIFAFMFTFIFLISPSLAEVTPNNCSSAWLDFDGVDDYVNFSSYNYNLSTITVYVKYKSNFGSILSTDAPAVFHAGYGSGNTEWFGIFIGGNSGKVRSYFDYGDDNCGIKGKESLINVSDYGWHNVISTATPRQTSNLIVDSYGSGYTSLSSCQSTIANSNDWMISRNAATYRFNGSVDSLIIYNNSLSSMQLNILYNNLTGENNIYIPVFYTHNINQTGSDFNVSTFTNFISYLNSSGYSSITDIDYYNWTQGRINISNKSFMLIFDDGQLSTRTIAAPIMATYRYRGISAVSTSMVSDCSDGQACPWNTTSMVYQFMNWTQVRELVSIYNWSLASHSYLHCHMDGTTGGTFNYGCNGTAVLGNMSKGKIDIINHTGFTPISFVHPYNSVNSASFSNCSLNYTLCFGAGSWTYQGASYLTKYRAFSNSNLTTYGELGRTVCTGMTTNSSIDWVINQTLPTMHILRNWQLNENSATTAYDSSGNGNHGTIYGATWHCEINGTQNDTQNPDNETDYDDTYCSSDIQGPLYTDYSTCSIEDNQYRTKYFIDYNYDSCCAVTNLSSDCEIKNSTYENSTEIQSCDYCTPNLINTSWSEWSNLGICTTKDIQNQSRFRVQYDNNSCGEIANQTFYDYQTVPCDYCNYTIAYTNWTGWKDQTKCRIDDTKTQARSRIQYDSNYGSCYAVTGLPSDLWVNKTYLDFQTVGCNYCSSNIRGPFYTSWSECSRAFTKNRTVYYIDYNYNKCCAITGLDSDCGINTIYKNVTQTQSCRLTVEGTLRGVYNTTQVPFGVYSKDNMIRLEYLDYFVSKSKWTTLCTNCYIYNKTRYFGGGLHNLTIKATFNNSIETLKVSFLVIPEDFIIS